MNTKELKLDITLKLMGEVSQHIADDLAKEILTISSLKDIIKKADRADELVKEVNMLHKMIDNKEE